MLRLLVAIALIGAHSSAQTCDPNRKGAMDSQRIWKEALSAKGETSKIESVLFTIGGSESRDKYREETVFLLPERMWDRTHPGHNASYDSAMVYNGTMGKTWLTYSDGSMSEKSTSEPGKTLLRRMQALLLQTKWFKPIVKSAHSEQWKSYQLNVVCTEEASEVYEFGFDGKTTMLVRLRVYRRAGERLLYEVWLKDYENFDGFQMPTRWSFTGHFGIASPKLSYTFNVRADDEKFESARPLAEFPASFVKPDSLRNR